MLLSNLLTLSRCIQPLPSPTTASSPWGRGRNLSCPPPLPWRLTVLCPHGTAPGALPSVAVFHPLLLPPSLFPPSWFGHQASQLRPSGLPWRTSTAAGAASGGRPPGGLGVSLPYSRGGRSPGRLPSRVGGGGTAALQPPHTPAGPSLLLHGGLLLSLLLQLPHCSL